jgi:hypothetical protein
MRKVTWVIILEQKVKLSFSNEVAHHHQDLLDENNLNLHGEGTM